MIPVTNQQYCKTCCLMPSDRRLLAAGHKVTLTQIFLSHWCRLKGLVRFLTILGLVKGFTILTDYSDLKHVHLPKELCNDHLLLYAAALVTAPS